MFVLFIFLLTVLGSRIFKNLNVIIRCLVECFKLIASYIPIIFLFFSYFYNLNFIPFFNIPLCALFSCNIFFLVYNKTANLQHINDSCLELGLENWRAFLRLLIYTSCLFYFIPLLVSTLIHLV